MRKAKQVNLETKGFGSADTVSKKIWMPKNRKTTGRSILNEILNKAFFVKYMNSIQCLRLISSEDAYFGKAF